jgi:hypothetical protein
VVLWGGGLNVWAIGGGIEPRGGRVDSAGVLLGTVKCEGRSVLPATVGAEDERARLGERPVLACAEEWVVMIGYR